MDSANEKPDPRIEQLTAQLQQEKAARLNAEQGRDAAVAERDQERRARASAEQARDSAVSERDRARTDLDQGRRQLAATRTQLQSARNWNVGLGFAGVVGLLSLFGGGRR